MNFYSDHSQWMEMAWQCQLNKMRGLVWILILHLSFNWIDLFHTLTCNRYSNSLDTWFLFHVSRAITFSPNPPSYSYFVATPASPSNAHWCGVDYVWRGRLLECEWGKQIIPNSLYSRMTAPYFCISYHDNCWISEILATKMD